MKKTTLIFLLAILTTGLAHADELLYTLLDEFTSPGPSPQGLAWDGEALWCVDDSTDTVYRLDPDTGDILHSFPSPDSTPRGITWDGSYLWIAESDAEKLYRVDAETGEVVRGLDAHYSTREDSHWPLMSLAWDGTRLWCNYSAGYSSKIAIVDPVSGEFERTEFFEQYEGMAWHDGLWGIHKNGIWNSFVEYHYFEHDINHYTNYKTKIPQYYGTGLATNYSLFWLCDEDTDRIYVYDFVPEDAVTVEERSIHGFVVSAYPNPFNPSTTISFTLPDAAQITLDVYAITGQKVATLVDAPMSPGTHTAIFNGSGMASGIYFYRLSADGRAFTGRMVLMK